MRLGVSGGLLYMRKSKAVVFLASEGIDLLRRQRQEDEVLLPFFIMCCRETASWSLDV